MHEIQLRPNIADGDLKHKVNTAHKFLKDKEQVKVVIQFRGREITHQELGWKLLQKVADMLSDVAKIGNQPKLNGKMLSVVLFPLSNKPPDIEVLAKVPVSPKPVIGNNIAILTFDDTKKEE